MATTTNFALRYPLSTGTVQVHTDLQNLATDTDTAMLGVKNPVGSIGVRSTNQTIGNAAFTDMTWPTEEFDNMAGFTAGGSVITVSVAGVYNVKAGVKFPANGTGTRSMLIIIDGVELPGGSDERIPTAAASTRMTVSADVKLNAGQQVKIQVFQSSGGNLDVQTGRFSVLRSSGT
jgi:hypothetical protein